MIISVLHHFFSHRPLRRVLQGIAVMMLLTLSACATSDAGFFGKAYHNFTAYFNSYYNAQIEFDRGVKAIAASQLYGRTSVLGIFPSIETAASGKANFDLVIKKTVDILKAHPQSDIADDALLLLGKAYYYNREFPLAERKFQEIISNYPDGDRLGEATFWYGRTLAQQQSLAEAREVLGRVIASSKSDNESKSDAHFALAELAIRAEEYAVAVTQIQLGLPLTSDRDLKGRAAFTLARIYDLLGNYINAEKTYQQVLDLDPRYELRYASQINYAVDLREQGRIDQSITYLKTLLADGKNIDRFAEIRYELSLCYERQDRIGQAIDLYIEIIRKHPRTEQSARSFYRLGTIRQEVSLDYAGAKAFYDSARTEYAQGELGALFTKSAATMERILDLRYAVSNLDSVIGLGIRTDVRSDTAKRVEVDSVQSAAESNVLVRRTRKDYRRSVFYALGGTDAFSETTVKVVTAQARRSFPVARDTLSFVAYQKELIDKKFATGNFYHITLPIEDSAALWYERTLVEIQARQQSGIDSSFLSSTMELTLFSLADVYRTEKQDAKVDSLYRLLLQAYPAGRYVNRVRAYYNLPPLRTEDREPDKRLYLEGHALISGKKSEEAVKRFAELLALYPRSPLAPKALLSLGYVYESVPNRSDSAVAIYKRLNAAFPKSPEAASISEKMVQIGLFERRAKAVADSIRSDSLARVPKPTAADSLKNLKTVKPDMKDLKSRSKLSGATGDSAKVAGQSSKGSKSSPSSVKDSAQAVPPRPATDSAASPNVPPNAQPSVQPKRPPRKSLNDSLDVDK